MPLSLVHILLGEKADVNPKYQRGSCYRFFAPPKGIFQSVSGLESARLSNGVLDLGFSMKPGTHVHDISGDADRPGFIVSVGANRSQAITNADEAIKKIHFKLQEFN